MSLRCTAGPRRTDNVLMGTLRDTRRLFGFDDWANGQVMRALAPLEATAPTAVAWMGHVMAAKRLWFARVTQGTPPFSVNPDLTRAAIVHELREAHDEWMRYLDGLRDDDLEGVIRYQNLKGEPFESPLGDILTHLVLHGQHHRGQCLAAIRQAGTAPPVIDFIHASRTGAI